MSHAVQPSHREHKEKAKTQVLCGVITVSDTRTRETDTSGQLILSLLERAGHRVSQYHIIKDEPNQIRPLLESLLADAAVDAVIINGGTGIARRDVTFDAIQTMFDKQLPGFGELFRMLSYQDIGSAALLSRATAGTAKGKAVFSVPGSRGAVELAMEKLILPEMPHIVFELHK
jgi:molybdopterin adenylyltransferase